MTFWSLEFGIWNWILGIREVLVWFWFRGDWESGGVIGIDEDIG